MKKEALLLITFAFLLVLPPSATAQNKDFAARMDSLLSAPASDTFNGIILISEKGVTKYSGMKGFADLDKKQPLNKNSQFVIGSISKQFTAVMVLQELEKGHLDLFTPIRRYLPELKQPWADTVTVHHLLTHMHGIAGIDRPALFKAGTRFDYSLSNTGYHLLSLIIERVSGESFAKISSRLFKKCDMKHTFHPDVKKYRTLVKGYTRQQNGPLEFETSSFENSPAAGGFISTAEDLVRWNEHLHHGKLLREETYRMLITKQEGAVRAHPLWGTTFYGYGITVTETLSVLQLGQTGFAPGFASMDFYFPQSNTSVIVLQNIVYDRSNLKRTFRYHIDILQLFKDNIIKK